jgi:Peptidase propeptide and YPEB domain
MLRAPAPRRLLVTAGAVVAAAGIGFGAYSLGSTSEPTIPQGPQVALEGTATPLPTDGKAAPATTSPTAPATSSALSLEQAKAVAARVAPGRVIEWDEDHEPTGLRYDVTLLHADGTTTDVEVDTVTGQVTSIDHDDDRD